MNKSKLIVLVVFALILIAFFALGGYEYLDKNKIEQSIQTINTYYQDHVMLTALIFFVVYTGKYQVGGQ